MTIEPISDEDKIRAGLANGTLISVGATAVAPLIERIDALLSRLDKAEADRNAVAGAFRWFYKYPEFTPSPDLQERWTADIQTAVDALGWKRSPDFTPFPRPLPPPPSES